MKKFLTSLLIFFYQPNIIQYRSGFKDSVTEYDLNFLFIVFIIIRVLRIYDLIFNFMMGVMGVTLIINDMCNVGRRSFFFLSEHTQAWAQTFVTK